MGGAIAGAGQGGFNIDADLPDLARRPRVSARAGGLGEDCYTESPDFICRRKVIHHPGMVRASRPEGPATLAGRDDAVGYC